MYPYQLSKVMADQRVHDMVTASAHHQRDLSEQSSDLRVNTSWLARTVTLFDGLRSANGLRSSRSRSTVTSTSGAGPMGCSA